MSFSFVCIKKHRIVRLARKEVKVILTDIIINALGFVMFGFLSLIGLFITHLVWMYAFKDMTNTELSDLLLTVSFLASAILFVGIWFSATDSLKISPFPCNIFDIYIVFTFIGILCILFAISYYIVGKYINKMEKMLNLILHHPVKMLLSGFSVGSIIITVVAYYMGISTANHYRLSWYFVIPKTAQAIPSVLFFTLMLVVLTAFPFFVYWILKLINTSNSRKKKKGYLAPILCFVVSSIFLVFLFSLLFLINIRATLIPNKYVSGTICIILFICIFISLLFLFLLESGVIKTQEQFGNKNTALCYSVTKNNVHTNKVKRIIISFFAIPYIIVSVISIMSFGKIIFSPNSGKNEFEYITTAEYGNCVVLMKNGSEYILEKFTFDENSQTIYIDTNQYYVKNLDSVEIKRISYKEEILLPND